MLVENLEHLDYYSAQWMVTFSIGAILTTSKEVADFAKTMTNLPHTAILYCEKIKGSLKIKLLSTWINITNLFNAREGIIN